MTRSALCSLARNAASGKLLKSAAAHLLESQALSRMAAISSGNRGAAGTRGIYVPGGIFGLELNGFRQEGLILFEAALRSAILDMRLRYTKRYKNYSLSLLR